MQAYKADNCELINSRVPGAALLTCRCLRQGHSAEVTSPLSNGEKPELVIFCFRHSFAVSQDGQRMEDTLTSESNVRGGKGVCVGLSFEK